MRHTSLSLAVALALSAGGCLVSTSGSAGAPCESDEECSDASDQPQAYHCAPEGDGGVNRCFLRFPPVTAQDAGVDAGPSRTVYYCGEVEQLLVIQCASCHGEDRSGGLYLPFRIDVYEDTDGGSASGGLDGAKTKAARIKVRAVDAKSNPMPPASAGTLSAEEKALLNDWVLSGAPHCDGGP